jgi:hypothetical protein
VDEVKSDNANLLLTTNGVVETCSQLFAGRTLSMCCQVPDNIGKRERMKLLKVRLVLEFLVDVATKCRHSHNKSGDKVGVELMKVRMDYPKSLLKRFKDWSSIADLSDFHCNVYESLADATARAKGSQQVERLISVELSKKYKDFRDSILFFLFNFPTHSHLRPPYKRGIEIDNPDWPWNVLLFSSVGWKYVMEDDNALQLVDDAFVNRIIDFDCSGKFILPSDVVLRTAPYGFDYEYMIPIDKIVRVVDGLELAPVVAPLEETEDAEVAKVAKTKKRTAVVVKVSNYISVCVMWF